jgi:PhzF family phenazine biosynthesis protein
MKIPLFQIDAFSDRVFAGNPAAVCLLDQWLDDPVLQAIAAENNLSETAFIVRSGDTYEIRWFTPQQEVDLCGHATLASGFVVLKELEPEHHAVTFISRSGPLGVQKQGERLLMSFPVRSPVSCSLPDGLAEGRMPRGKEDLQSSDEEYGLDAGASGYLG